MNKPEGLPIVLKRPSAIILSDDAGFVQPVVTRWQMDRCAPEIKVAGSDQWQFLIAEDHDLIIVDSLHLGEALSISLVLRDAPGKPVICVMADHIELRTVKPHHANLLIVEQRDDWVATLIVLGNEILRRVEALGRAHRAERSASESQRYATLGRYMLDMRPGVNDALTSILGNADLLLLDPDQDVQDVREQIKAIHSMSLRLNEIMQRFSSLATEMQNAKEDIPSRLAPRETTTIHKAHPTR